MSESPTNNLTDNLGGRYARQAIETIWKPCTGERGARILARCSAQSRTYGQGYLGNLLEKAGVAESNEHLHVLAARLLAVELGWSGKDGRFTNMTRGVIKNGNYVHVFTPVSA